MCVAVVVVRVWGGQRGDGSHDDDDDDEGIGSHDTRGAAGGTVGITLATP